VVREERAAIGKAWAFHYGSLVLKGKRMPKHYQFYTRVVGLLSMGAPSETDPDPWT